MELHRELCALLGRLRVLQTLELGQVGARAEPLPCARQHYAADAFILVRAMTGLEQRMVQLRVERIALLRTVHRQNADGVPVFHKQHTHRDASLRRASSASATSRRMISAAGRISSTSPALCPASTLPHSTSPSSAACFRDEVL